MIECTFKPNVNNANYEQLKATHGVTMEEKQSVDLWSKLHREGLQLKAGRKDKPKEELEVELYGKECTFKPNITKLVIKNNARHSVNIYNDKSYDFLYNRMKQGRLERFIRDSVHERGEFPEELDEYCNFK